MTQRYVYGRADNYPEAEDYVKDAALEVGEGTPFSQALVERVKYIRRTHHVRIIDKIEFEHAQAQATEGYYRWFEREYPGQTPPQGSMEAENITYIGYYICNDVIPAIEVYFAIMEVDGCTECEEHRSVYIYIGESEEDVNSLAGY